MHALSFNLVKCSGKTTRAISLTETRTWSLTLLSKDYTIDGHPVRIALHNTLCILAGRENTMACMRGVSKHRRAQYRFVVFTIGLRLRDIPDDLPMWRYYVGLSQHVKQSFPIHVARTCTLNASTLKHRTKKEIPFLNKIPQNNFTIFSPLVILGVIENMRYIYIYITPTGADKE